MKKVIFVLGATATGKSNVAIHLAKTFGGSIVNCDSVQFYNDLYIGSAAPSPEDKAQAPHYLYNCINAPEEFTAGEFVRAFYKLLEENKDIQFPLIVTGGTGFYIQALEKGMYDVPQIDPELKKQIEDDISKNGAEAYYQELIAFDPETKIHFNDHYRIGRAIEVKRQFGLKMTELAEQKENKNSLQFPYLKIGLNFESKEDHRNQVIKRTQKMLKEGLIGETQKVLDRGFTDWAPMNSVGYLETKKYLQGELPESELEPLIVQSTMQLIKKQKNWFKRDDLTKWFECKNLDLNLIEIEVKKFLKT